MTTPESAHNPQNTRISGPEGAHIPARDLSAEHTGLPALAPDKPTTFPEKPEFPENAEIPRDTTRVKPTDFAHLSREDFMEVVRAETRVLKILEQEGLLERLQRPRFGYESEYFLVSATNLEPIAVSEKILRAAAPDPTLLLTHEMGKYQIERLGEVIQDIGGESLARLESFMLRDLHALEGYAAKRGATVIPTGMLPTLKYEHLAAELMTGNGGGRYAVASEAALEQHGGPWEVVIPAIETALSADRREVRYPVANTMSVAQTCSLQPHIQCSPEQFVDLYNGFLLSAGFALAPATASPLVQGQVAQKESRIEAFEQAWIEGRVFLGNGYISSISEPFVENAEKFDPVFVEALGGNPEDEAPALNHLRLQNGSIHRWVRPVYDAPSPEEGPHVRIELRTLPMSAAPHDNVANTALAIGLAYGFAKMIDGHPEELLSFEHAKENLKQAARHGLDAEMWFPGNEERVSLSKLKDQLIVVALDGLQAAGVDPDVAEKYLSSISARFSCCPDGNGPARTTTEADWIIRSLEALELGEQPVEHEEALRRITREIHRCALLNIPVHERPILSGTSSTESSD